MNQKNIGVPVLTLAFASVMTPPIASASSCEALAKLALPDTTITLAEAVPAGGLKLPAAGGPGGGPGGGQRNPYGALPAFCRVAGTIRPTPDSDIRFEVWMPASGWNGKFVGVGNGVWAGSISYFEMITPLTRGYATAATDVGHQGNPLDASFAAGHPEKLVDFGHRAMHEMTQKAKTTVERFYEKKPQRSLYASCSTGGRIGLMEAYRYPDDYDGISAMAPANEMVPLMIGSLWTGYVALRDDASRLPPAKLMKVRDAAKKACDAKDGVTDGIISNPPACSFDPAVLACKAGDAPDCLTAAQLTALKAVYAGPRNPRTGAQIDPGFSVGAEAMFPAQTAGPEPFGAATSFVRSLVIGKPDWDFRSFDYDRDTALAKSKFGAILDVPATGLGPYFDKGRKLLLSHGWADGLIPAMKTVNFHDALTKSIGTKKAADGVRLFMIPGMGHCAGGDGPSNVDMLGVLDAWVESGKAPERIVASNPPGAPARTRPLCAHPQVAKYTGSGSTDEENSFRCERP